MTFELARAPAGMTITPGGDRMEVPDRSERSEELHVVLKVTDSKGGEATQTIELAR